ncbi:carboxypeptidase-like regulatory domain-containing protein [Lysobacter sp. S4-A87]|uniref:carboxypeptidase-like regulatory domain-containing protein n=1 Tax=Lysobacter sp. S4-A87 TaxID=2925843 RepID=UPI001F532672|nr:carboxypeptidase-like regulatory domain-containing protein [Lysobacter sp. S4-A87]UNK48380.1 carboxypeptidase-like regulatory domain-containing protein [Lysobacter sp. S4-A87]
MTSRRRPIPLALAAGVVAALAGVSAWAQEASPNSPTPYQDRIISSSQLAPLSEDEDELTNLDGLPRSTWFQLDYSRNSQGDESFEEKGVSGGGFWESAAYGTYSVDATIFRDDGGIASDGGWSGSASVWQRNLFLDGGWLGSNGLGVLNTPTLGLQRSQYRFILPTVAFAGASTDWIALDGWQVQAAYGRAGNFTGTRMLGFDLADGNVASFGVQHDWSPQLSGAVSFLGTDGRLVPDEQGDPSLVPAETYAAYAATAWRGERDMAQLNLLASDADAGNAQGVWVDANSRRGRMNHNYGVFRLEPELSWGDLPISSDVEGGYYRGTYQYGRWMWSGGLDAVHSIDGSGFSGLYATNYARYQVSTNFGYGGSLSLLRGHDDRSHSMQFFMDNRSDAGDTRLQFDQAENEGNRSWQINLDQAWPLRQGSRLSTSVGYGALSYDDKATTRSLLLAAYGAVDLGERLSLDGSARWADADGPDGFRGLDLNVSLNWRIRPRWSLLASVYQSEGSRISPFVLDPLVPDNQFINQPRDRSVFLTLRYDWHAGRSQSVLGGRPGAAAGGLRGSVYLDDNADGQRSASELAAANVTVLLDNRYAVRTDSRGEFEFPRVAAGAHTVTIVPDNLPLPWSLEGGAASRSIDVTVRGQTRVDFGAIRPR